jgi:hypothetical protein
MFVQEVVGDWRLVMPQDTERDTRLIGYLLGELVNCERTRLEDEYLGDSELFEKLLDAEDELIHAYVRGGLSPSQRVGFEQIFLQTQERKARVVFAREFIACLGELHL